MLDLFDKLVLSDIFLLSQLRNAKIFFLIEGDLDV
jgi:hypothetical protein